LLPLVDVLFFFTDDLLEFLLFFELVEDFFFDATSIAVDVGAKDLRFFVLPALVVLAPASIVVVIKKQLSIQSNQMGNVMLIKGWMITTKRKVRFLPPPAAAEAAQTKKSNICVVFFFKSLSHSQYTLL
jgi:hypothetical protein